MSSWIENALADRITFCPQGELLERFRTDYENMKRSFIYGSPLPFDALIERIVDLQARFRMINFLFPDS